MGEDITRRLGPSAETNVGARVQHVPGERIGDWIVGERLGGGGFGDVYAAHHYATRQPAALKVLHAHFVASTEVLARFERETNVLTRLQHPSIVSVIDAGFDDSGRPYLCMELLVGQDLSSVIAAAGRLAPEIARPHFESLCDAIAVAHDLGIVHRDIKASNVFVRSADGRAVLLDFGIAKISDALEPELTASHQSLGTPGCMAPEQIHGGRIDARTDVYALGGLLFHMLTGRLVFHDPSETMTQYLHLHARRPRASSLAPVPTTVDDVIIRAMAIEPADRYPNVRALATGLRQALRGSLASTTSATVEHTALLVAIADRTGGTALDERLIADLESVLPAAERLLSVEGYSLALDLGSTAVFIAPSRDVSDAVRVALSTWDLLEQRAGRDSRVQIGICVHRGPAMIVGNRVEPCELLRPETWDMPDLLEGVWVTSAIEPTPRRLR
jgi:eukaryotic-like serine/threonine-protein kinase